MNAYKRIRTLQGLRGQRDEGFVMVFTILLILIVVALSIAITGVVLNQVRPTQLAKKNVRTINAAEAGLQVALNQLRTSTDSVGAGSLLAVPCDHNGTVPFTAFGQSNAATDGAVFSGSVSNGAGNLTYSASVAYFSSDPTGHLNSWLSSNAMNCPLSAVPSYAYIQTHGAGAAVPGSTAAAANRTEHATYQFATQNTNSAGGRMKEFGVNLCMQVVAYPPTSGTTMKMAPCLALGTPSQTWQYRTDLSIFYGGDTTLNLCVEKAPNGSAPTLKTCLNNGTSYNTYPYSITNQEKQEWGFNDNGHFSIANSDGSVTNAGGGSCLQPAGANDSTPAVSGAAVNNTVCDSGTSGYTAWNPDPQVGAGKAGGNISGTPGAPTNQYVNYFEFGRCLDITGTDVNADHLIDYPCKQSPDSSRLTFNQVWTFSVVAGVSPFGTMSVNKAGTLYCLQDGQSTGYILTKACTSTLATQQWNPTGRITGDYNGSYNLVNKSTGKCMSVDPNNQLTNLSSTIVSQTCDGSLKQKWNAPPNLTNPGPGNVSEDGGAN